MKKCFKCREIKELSDFYRHPRMGDGYLNKCKECTKRDTKADYERKKVDPAWMARERKRTRERNQRLGYTEKYRNKTESQLLAIKRNRQLWLDKNREKRAAHVLLGNAVRAGRVKKLPCQVCGATGRVEGHHEDYAKPLDVVWLCPKHHKERHRKDK